MSLLVLLLCACERKTETTAPDEGDATPAPVDDDAEAEEGGDRPVPVEQLLKIEGPLSEAAITTMQQDKINDLRDCFNDALQNPDGLELNGAVVVKFTVDKTGAVTSSLVELDEVGHKPSAQCLAKVIESYKFPKQKGESSVFLPLYSNSL